MEDRRPHILMVPVAFPGHFAPFVQLLYQLNDQKKDIMVTVLGNKDRLGELGKLHERGDFKHLDLHMEVVFGEIPVYKLDPKFPIRAALLCEAMEKEFEAVKERFIQGKNDVGAPTSLVVDMFLWWTKDLADEMGVPWYTFYSTSSWYGVCALETPLLVKENFHPVHSDRRAEKSTIPGLEFAHIYDFPHEVVEFDDFYCKVSDRTLRATGILVNSSLELDGNAGSLEAMEALVARRWKLRGGQETELLPVGPMAQLPGFGVQFSAKDAPSEGLKWLETQAEQSVLYVAFGSLGSVSEECIMQLALGLEASGVAFLWALKVSPAQMDRVLPRGFMDRVKGRGFIETGWAPQTRILCHAATGGFLSHCGWNSTIESLCCGVPMIAWPLSADQPLNARFIVEVRKVGVAVLRGGADDSVVSMEDVSRAVRLLMVEEHGKEIKSNSVELKKALAASVAEGGSTFETRRRFIQSLLHKHNN